MIRAAAAVLLAAAVAAHAAPADSPLRTRTVAAGQAPPAASIADLAWLEGEWTGEGFDSALHENYSAPIGGQIPAHFYAVQDGKPTFYEFETFAQIGNSLEFRVRHFNPDMTAWEDKDRVVRFPLVAVDRDVWYFDGYTVLRTGPDTADHIIRIRRKDGTESEAVLHYRRRVK
jgi:hypothetical protein